MTLNWLATLMRRYRLRRHTRGFIQAVGREFCAFDWLRDSSEVKWDRSGGGATPNVDWPNFVNLAKAYGLGLPRMYFGRMNGDPMLSTSEATVPMNWSDGSSDTIVVGAGRWLGLVNVAYQFASGAAGQAQLILKSVHVGQAVALARSVQLSQPTSSAGSPAHTHTVYPLGYTAGQFSAMFLAATASTHADEAFHLTGWSDVGLAACTLYHHQPAQAQIILIDVSGMVT